MRIDAMMILVTSLSPPGSRPTAVVSGERRSDLLADEAPLELRVQEADGPPRAVAVLMRTRLIGEGDGGDDGDSDLDLAAGFLVTEGVITDVSDVDRLAACDVVESPDAEGNVVIAKLKAGVVVDWARLVRHTYASSSCGVCGKATIEAVCARVTAPVPQAPALTVPVVQALVAALAAQQPLFAATGAVHGAALAHVDGNGRIDVVAVREDVGRHCAVDKVIGAALRAGQTPRGLVLVVSGRVAFEIVQKAVSVGLSAIVAIGAPTSLATDLAREAGVTVVGFVRGERATWYAGAPKTASVPG